ncbi:GntR family transcriptional regulator [Aureimonas sp. Leaf454]|uniref:GntR family transcriptional regulator n=1 Tax=Aureimonas sp. Leaf454 TaxID=1736381 RepID=UPI0006FF1AD5|nr:GntR family transcriptional regulator [Aureimonas sp. Leaf454]KQT54099.1 GntR family transcriptional regulator [Aureimonas sp. Leaf454]
MSKPNTLFKEAYNRSLRLLETADGLPSETELGAALDVSRTTVRSILGRLEEGGLIRWNKREKTLLRRPKRADYYPDSETDPLSQIIERGFMHRILAGGAHAGDLIGEADIARDLGVGVSAVREFLIRFSRFGLIEKRRNSQWVLKGFTREFALELTEVREMFELRAVQRFAALPPDNPAWLRLDEMEAEHRTFLETVETRYEAFSELDERFHRLIHEASRNRFVIDFYDVISMIFHYHYQWNKTGEKDRNRVALSEHIDYIAALKSRDATEVEFFCRRHLRSARTTLLQSIAPVGAPPGPPANDPET